jgi:hypothetical protein
MRTAAAPGLRQAQSGLPVAREKLARAHCAAGKQSRD